MKKNVTLSALLIAGILIMINILSNRYFLRFDITKDRQYTLSSATKNVLKSLQDPVTVTAYFSKDLPADILKTKQDFKEMLAEYATRSKGKLNYEFIDPASDPDLEGKLAQQGIQPIMISVREKDQSKQQKAFLAAVIKYGEQEEILPFIQPGSSMEYDLTTNIKRMTVSDKPFVGIIQGDGEPELQQLSQLYQSLSVQYSIETINLTSVTEIAPRYRAVLWIKPMDSIPPQRFAMLSDYLDHGGQLILAYDAVEGNFQTAQGDQTNQDITAWLQTQGIQVEPAFAVDANCGTVTVQQNQGFMVINTPVKFPYLPLIQSFNGNQITEGLEQVMLQFASPIRSSVDSSGKFTSILETSERSGIERTPVYFDVNRTWQDSDFPMHQLTVGAMVQYLKNGISSRLVVYTDGDFAVSGQRGTMQDNVSLLSNTVDYLCDDTGLVSLRTKAVVTRPIKDLDDSTRTLLKWMNFLLPILLIIIYGFIRSQRQRALRVKRMQENFG
ncbi:MAG: GldG family protein [Lewinellaceae bacterium]|nr:GldG family protein [Lewinellaceae bacterium]HQU53020.1 GldG family protein [Saprospiraceae bacterium]